MACQACVRLTRIVRGADVDRGSLLPQDAGRSFQFSARTAPSLHRLFRCVCSTTFHLSNFNLSANTRHQASTPPPSTIHAIAVTTTGCLLLRLPKELRDNIYDLVFATEHKNATIQFATARSLAPSVNLLLTNRTINQDAEKAYQTSYIAFWSENIFVLPHQLRYDACRITAKDLHHIKRIRMITDDVQNQHKDGEPYIYGCLDLQASDEDPLNWTVLERQADDALGDTTAAGLARWMKVMSRLTLKCCTEQQSLKKQRLDEIIAALWRLAGANSQAINKLAHPAIMRRL